MSWFRKNVAFFWVSLSFPALVDMNSPNLNKGPGFMRGFFLVTGTVCPLYKDDSDPTSVAYDQEMVIKVMDYLKDVIEDACPGYAAAQSYEITYQTVEHVMCDFYKFFEVITGLHMDGLNCVKVVLPEGKQEITRVMAALRGGDLTAILALGTRLARKRRRRT